MNATQEEATINPQPRQAAFKTDLFVEIDELTAKLQDATIINTILTLLSIVLATLSAALGAIIYFAGIAG